MRTRLAVGLALLLVACGDGRGTAEESTSATTTDATSGTSGTGSSTTADTGESSDASTGDATGSSGTDGTTDASTSESDTTGDPCGLPECKLNGAFGFHVRIPVTWEAAGPVAAGNGTVRVTLRAVLGTAGNDVSGSAEVCEMLVPWYLEDGGNEKVDLDWRDELFPSSIPDVMVTGTTCGALPEQTVDFDAVAVQIGVDLPGPLNAAWPLDWHDVPIADHDGDGRPAFTVLSGNGQTTSPAPLDVGKIDRAHFVYIASRVVAQATATMVDCDTAMGEAEVPYLDGDVVACRICQGDQPASCVDQAMDCSDDQIDYLNGYLLDYEIGVPTFKLARVDPSFDCETIATYF